MYVLIKRGKKIILGDRITQGLDNTTLTAEKMYSINFTVTKLNFCLTLHYIGANSYLFGNGTEIIKFKAKDSELVVNPFCFRNISEDLPVENMKKNGLYGSVFDFSVNYRTIAVEAIFTIHKYLMKKKMA